MDLLDIHPGSASFSYTVPNGMRRQWIAPPLSTTSRTTNSKCSWIVPRKFGTDLVTGTSGRCLKPMTLRDWTDPRDGRDWTVWLERESKPVLAFGSEGELHTVVVDFSESLEGRSDEDLQRLLDEGRGRGQPRQRRQHGRTR